MAAAAGLVILGLNLLLQWTESESILSQNETRIQRLFLLGHQPGTIARRLIFRQILVLSFTVMAGLGLVWWMRESVVSSLRQAGLVVEKGLDPLTLLCTLTLFAFLCIWLNLKISLRLKRLYLQAN